MTLGRTGKGVTCAVPDCGTDGATTVIGDYDVSFVCECGMGEVYQTSDKTCVCATSYRENTNGDCAASCDSTAMLVWDTAAGQCVCASGYEEDSNGDCTEVDECLTDNAGCSQNCVDSEGSYACECNDSHSLNVDGVTCDNIGECLDKNDGCSNDCAAAGGRSATQCVQCSSV